MIDHDAGRALTAMAHAVTLGRDPRTVTEELVRHLRNAFLSLMAPELVLLPSERLDSLMLQAQQVGAAALVRAIEKLGTTLVDMRSAPDPRVLVEVVLVQLTHPEASGDVEALVARIERLEQKVKSFGDAGPAKAASGPTDPATGRAVLGGAARRPPADSSPTHSSQSLDQSSPSTEPPPTTPPLEPVSVDAGNERAAGDTPAVTERAVLGSGARRPTPDRPMVSGDRSTEQSGVQHSGAPEGRAGATPSPSSAPAVAAAPQPTGLSVPDAWDRSLKTTITPLMVRALFAAGTFVGGSGERWKFDLPSAAHAARCEPHRAVIESQLAALVGSPGQPRVRHRQRSSRRRTRRERRPARARRHATAAVGSRGGDIAVSTSPVSAQSADAAPKAREQAGDGTCEGSRSGGR